jgi:2'-5' RNA ligase
VERDVHVGVLTAAGVEDPAVGEVYGLISDTPGGDTVVWGVVRASADGTERWTAGGWVPVPDGEDPVGAATLPLAGELLGDALDAAGKDCLLVLTAAAPKAWLPRRVGLTAAAGAVDGVYAAVSELDTTAVLNLVSINEGVAAARVDGEWVPDVEVLPHLLAAGVPLALVPPADVAGLLRAFDDHDAVFPVTAALDDLPADTEPNASGDAAPDFSDGVMVALPVDGATAEQLAVPGGLDPSEMHVTLAYLGTQDTVPLGMGELCDLVAEWAATQEPLSGEVSGPARFEGTANAENPVHVALADVPGLSEARNSLVDHLNGNGVPVDTQHGYSPHITRSYGDADVATDGVGGIPLSFGQVGVWHGADQQNIPFGGMLAAFNPAEKRDPTGKWTTGGGAAKQNQALEATRKTTGPHAAPTPKTVVHKPYVSPKSGGGGAGGGKGGAKKAAQAKKTALRQKIAGEEKQERDAETAAHRAALDAASKEQSVEQQRRIDYMRKYAAASPGDRKALAVAEQRRRLAWQTQHAESVSKETARHTAAMEKVAADKTRLDAELKKELAAVKASANDADSVVADAVATTRTPRQLERFWTTGPGGTAKIRWGEPHDYYRCLEQLGKYVHSSRQLHGQCANLHKIAIGVWPGREHGARGRHS